jgi:hypothetical protein
MAVAENGHPTGNAVWSGRVPDQPQVILVDGASLDFGFA